MERETGIEPATSSLGSWRSTAELLPLSDARLDYHSGLAVTTAWRVNFCGDSCLNGRPCGSILFALGKHAFIQNRLFATQICATRFDDDCGGRAVSGAERGASFRPCSGTPRFPVQTFELEEVTIAGLQDGMKSGKFTSQSLVEKYSVRIADVDKSGPAINAVIEMNPDALGIAEALDQERKAKGPRGPLHGVPVLIKDNIATADRMMTTAGSLALVGSKPPKDSVVAQRLRAAGAVILGKTNLSEWANIRSSHSTSGWSGRGGLTKNPYAIDRNPCGSSSGTGAGISANLAAVGIGTETDGSIVCPSSANGLAGIKPTVGLVSRTGIIPISHSQDTAGPMARTLRDAAILLGALTGVDSEDSATSASAGTSQKNYEQFCDPDGLKGARIGVARKYFGFSDAVDALMAESLDVLKRQGAILVDPADIETLGKFDDSESTVFMYELKADLNAYLARLGLGWPVKTLKDIIEFNDRNRDKEMPYFGRDMSQVTNQGAAH